MTLGRINDRHAVLFEDETDVLWFPPLQAAWARKGQPLPVTLTGGNARRVLFGTIHLRSGHRILLPQHRQRAEDFQLFLDVLAWHYRGWRPILLLDEDPSHTAAASQSVADDLGIELRWLPKRAPELNAMDHLWRHGKATVSVNHQYGSVDEHVDRLVDYLLSLPPEQARREAGLLSPTFWLRTCLRQPRPPCKTYGEPLGGTLTRISQKFGLAIRC